MSLVHFSDNLPQIEPRDALDAMLDVQWSIVEASHKLSDLVQQAQSSEPINSLALSARLDDVIASLMAFCEQVQFLWQCYRDCL
jgi:hypothetical protein